jgi:hypothetical protein
MDEGRAFKWMVEGFDPATPAAATYHHGSNGNNHLVYAWATRLDAPLSRVLEPFLNGQARASRRTAGQRAARRMSQERFNSPLLNPMLSV